MKKVLLLGLVFVLLIMPAVAVHAQSLPVLFKATIPGQPDGPTDLTFKLFDTPDVGTGTFLGYTDSQTGIQVTAEAFSDVLGAGSGGLVPASIFGANPSVFIATELTGVPGVEIAPRVSIPTLGNSVFTDAAGNVGIGTTSPQAGLDINHFANLRLRDAFDTGLFDIYVTSGTFSINEVTTGPISRISIAPGSGNVGIGTFTPTAKLDVAGNIAIGTGVNSNSGGFKHARFERTVLGSTGFGFFQLNWPSPFPDTNYTVTATVEDLDANIGIQLEVHPISSKTPSSVNIFMRNFNTVDKRVVIHLIGVHD